MDLNEIKVKLLENITELNLHDGSLVTSRSLYNKRMAVLNEMINIINNGINEYEDEMLVTLKLRIEDSIKIMKFADELGVVTEP